MTTLDDDYARISLDVDRDNPHVHIEELRRIASEDHIESMNLLAVLLGDVDSKKHREEIIRLYERAHELGSPVAAENLSIQYGQWKEPLLARYWMNKAGV